MTGPEAAVKITTIVTSAAVVIAALALHLTGLLWILLLLVLLGVFG